MTQGTHDKSRSDCSDEQTVTDRLLDEHDAAGVMITGPDAEDVHLVGERVATDGGAVEQTASDDELDWGAVSFVESSQYRMAVVETLGSEPHSVSAIAEASGYLINHISRALRRLRDRGLVAQREELGKPQERFYALTDAGRHAHATLDSDVEPTGRPNADVPWELIGYVAASEFRIACVERLAAGAAMPSTIAADTDTEIANISNALAQLRERGVIELLVDEDRRKGRYHGLTESGVALAAEHPEVEA